MWTTIERTYFSEVLGIDPPTLVEAGAPRPQAGEFEAEILVVTPRLDKEGEELLGKILSSVGLAGLPVRESIPPRAKIAHVLAFNGSGDAAADGAALWGFAEIRRMCGAAPEVNALKRATWDKLKKFKAALSGPGDAAPDGSRR